MSEKKLAGYSKVRLERLRRLIWAFRLKGNEGLSPEELIKIGKYEDFLRDNSQRDFKRNLYADLVIIRQFFSYEISSGDQGETERGYLPFFDKKQNLYFWKQTGKSQCNLDRGIFQDNIDPDFDNEKKDDLCNVLHSNLAVWNFSLTKEEAVLFSAITLYPKCFRVKDQQGVITERWQYSIIGELQFIKEQLGEEILKEGECLHYTIHLFKAIEELGGALQRHEYVSAPMRPKEGTRCIVFPKYIYCSTETTLMNAEVYSMEYNRNLAGVLPQTSLINRVFSSSEMSQMGTFPHEYFSDLMSKKDFFKNVHILRLFAHGEQISPFHVSVTLEEPLIVSPVDFQLHAGEEKVIRDGDGIIHIDFDAKSKKDALDWTWKNLSRVRKVHSPDLKQSLRVLIEYMKLDWKSNYCPLKSYAEASFVTHWSATEKLTKPERLRKIHDILVSSGSVGVKKQDLVRYIYPEFRLIMDSNVDDEEKRKLSNALTRRIERDLKDVREVYHCELPSERDLRDSSVKYTIKGDNEFFFSYLGRVRDRTFERMQKYLDKLALEFPPYAPFCESLRRKILSGIEIPEGLMEDLGKIKERVEKKENIIAHEFFFFKKYSPHRLNLGNRNEVLILIGALRTKTALVFNYEGERVKASPWSLILTNNKTILRCGKSDESHITEQEYDVAGITELHEDRDSKYVEQWIIRTELDCKDRLWLDRPSYSYEGIIMVGRIPSLGSKKEIFQDCVDFDEFLWMVYQNFPMIAPVTVVNYAEKRKYSKNKNRYSMPCEPMSKADEYFLNRFREIVHQSGIMYDEKEE